MHTLFSLPLFGLYHEFVKKFQINLKSFYELTDWKMYLMKESETIRIQCLGGYTSIAFLKRCPGYTEAKINGNMKAAGKVIHMCVDKRQTDVLRENFRHCIVIPVISENNALPIALTNNIGLAVCLTVKYVKVKSRKNLSAIERILYKPHFYGYIEPNESYILVDDIITQGGTISSLMKFVIESGGYICAVVALAYSKWSKAIISKYENLDVLISHFGSGILDFFKDFGIGEGEIDYFTNSEIIYLLRFSSVGRIKEKLKKIQRQSQEKSL